MPGKHCSLTALNELSPDDFVQLLGGVFEHSPWIARAAYAARPFGSIEELHAAMLRVVADAGTHRQQLLLQAHPELARPGGLTAASQAEQGSMGLDRLAADEAAVFDALNGAYRTRFGFPFIIAVRGQRDRAAIIAALEVRVRNAPDQELTTALAEVAKITRFRLDDIVSESGDGA